MSRVHVWLGEIETGVDPNTFVAAVLSCDPDFGTEGDTHLIGHLKVNAFKGEYAFDAGDVAPNNMLPPEAFLDMEAAQALINSHSFTAVSHSRQIHVLAMELLKKLASG